VSRLIRNFFIYAPAIFYVANLARQVGSNMGANDYIGAIAVLGWAVLLLSIERIPTPSIKAEGVNEDLEPPFGITVDKNGIQVVVTRYFLTLRNKRWVLPAKDTDPVHAHISFWDTKFIPLEKLSHEKPFWFDGPPATRENPKGISKIIQANQSPEHLCIVAKRANLKGVYCFSYDSYVRRNKSLSPFREEFRIPTKQFYVRIKLSAGNWDSFPIWVLVNEPEDGLHLEFEVLNKRSLAVKKIKNKLWRNDN
jgi:hypothetical protein